MKLGRQRPAPPGGPLVRWRDLRAALQPVIDSGQIEISGADVVETPDGVAIAFKPRVPLVPPFNVTLGDDAESVTISPGAVFGGSQGYALPTCGGQLLIEPVTLALGGASVQRVWLRVDYEPIIVRKEFDGSPNQGLLTGTNCDYFTWAGFRITEAEVAAGPTLPATVNWSLNLADGSWTPGVAVGQIARIEDGELVFFSGGICSFRTEGGNPNLLFRKLPSHLTTP